MKQNKHLPVIRISEDLLKKLKEYANREDVSLSQATRLAIKKLLKNYVKNKKNHPQVSEEQKSKTR